MRVLIADDSHIMRKIIKANLIRLGVAQADILESADGATAYRTLSTSDKIGLVFTDLNMPNMNGVEFVQKAREIEKYKSVKIVAISEHLDGLNEKLLADMGVVDYVPKPFNLERFNEIVEPILQAAQNSKDGTSEKILSKDELEKIVKSSDAKMILEGERLDMVFEGGKITMKFRDFLAICKSASDK